MTSCSSDDEELVPMDSEESLPLLVGEMRATSDYNMWDTILFECVITNLSDSITTLTAGPSTACIEVQYGPNHLQPVATYEYFPIEYPSIEADSSRIAEFEYVLSSFDLSFDIFPDFNNQVMEREENMYSGDCK